MNRRLIETRRRKAKQVLFDRGYYPLPDGRRLAEAVEMALPGIMVDMMHLAGGKINIYQMASDADYTYHEETK